MIIRGGILNFHPFFQYFLLEDDWIISLTFQGALQKAPSRGDISPRVSLRDETREDSDTSENSYEESPQKDFKSIYSFTYNQLYYNLFLNHFGK